MPTLPGLARRTGGGEDRTGVRKKDWRDGVQWLKVLSAVMLLALLVIAYQYCEEPGAEDGWRALGVAVIPGCIVVVIAGVVGYYALERWGLGRGMAPPAAGDGAEPVALHAAHQKLRDEIVDQVAQLPIYTEPLATSAPEVRRFWPSHRKVSWDVVLGNADALDIVVVYYETWIDENREELMEIFKRGGTIRLYLTDPEDVAAMAATKERFPEHDVEALREKVRGTARMLDEVRKASGNYHARLDVLLYPGVLNYAAIRADEDQVLMSVYEHGRERRIDSPAILLDLAASQAVKEFWDKEMRCLHERSRPAPPGFVETGDEEEAA